MVLFGLFFAATSFTKSMGPILLRDSPRWLKHIPSGIALFVTPPSFCSSLVLRSLPADRDFFSFCSAIGFLNTPSFSIARLLGGIIALRFSRGGKVPLIGTSQSAHIPSTRLLTLHNPSLFSTNSHRHCFWLCPRRGSDVDSRPGDEVCRSGSRELLWVSSGRRRVLRELLETVGGRKGLEVLEDLLFVSDQL